MLQYIQNSLSLCYRSVSDDKEKKKQLIFQHQTGIYKHSSATETNSYEIHSDRYNKCEPLSMFVYFSIEDKSTPMELCIAKSIVNIILSIYKAQSFIFEPITGYRCHRLDYGCLFIQAVVSCKCKLLFELTSKEHSKELTFSLM